MKNVDRKQVGVINPSDLKTFKGQLVYWAIFSVLVILCLICIVPTLWVLCTGFKDTQEIYQGASFFPKNFNWDSAVENIQTAVRIIGYGSACVNTTLLTIGDIVFSLASCTLAGFVLSRLKPAGIKFVFVLIVWTMLIPGQLRTVPLFISWLDFPFLAKLPGEVSLMNTYWPMWLGCAANAFNIILFKNHFDSISMSLVEAARIDGLSDLGILWKIMIPLSGPIIVYTTIMTVMGSWSNFFTGYLVLTEKKYQILPVRLFLLQGASGIKMNTVMIGSILSSLPMFIVFVIFQKQIIGGVNIGGVKG